MPDSKIVSCTATADARRQKPMLSRKRRCRTAKPFPAKQPRMLSTKTRCCPRNADAGQENRFLHSNRGCLDSKTRCCLGKNLPDSMKLFAKHVFFQPRSSVL